MAWLQGVQVVVGELVETVVAVDADDCGHDLPPGTRATVHELPSTNGGLFSIAVGKFVYDVEPGEIRPIKRVAGTDALRRGALDCAACGKEGSMRCSRCKQVWFCSKSCQRAHWAMHKASCSPPASSSIDSACKQLEHVSVVAHRGPEHGETESNGPMTSADGREAAWLQCVQLWFFALSSSSMDSILEALESMRSSVEHASECGSPGSSEMNTLRAERHLFLGVSYLDAGQREAGLTHLGTALDLCPWNEQTILELSTALEETRLPVDLQKAKTVADSAVAKGILWVDKWQRPGTLVRVGDAGRSVRSRPFWDGSEPAFAWVPRLEEATPMITEELRALLETPSQSNLWATVGGGHRSSGKRRPAQLVISYPQHLCFMPGQHDADVVHTGDWREVVR